MTEMDPPRLTDAASGAPDDLRRLFEAGARDLPSDAEVARLSAKLGPLLGPSGAAPAPAGSAAGGMAKLGAAVAALVGGAVLVASLNDEVPSAVPDPRPQPVEPLVPAPKDEATSAPTGAAPAPVDESPSAQPSAADSPTPRPERRSSAELEVELLERARKALAGNPGHALSLTAEHRLRFPGGALSQEREVIAIDALRALGRHDQASLRAEEFAKNYPGSAHRRKLDTGVTR